MPSFDAIYTIEQREAAGYAYVDRGIKPAQRVSDLAAAGELTLRGERLEPFTMPANTVRDIARKMRKRRAGEIESAAANLPARDAIEALRRRFVRVLDNELAVVERMKPGTVKAEHLRQLARVGRELAALPGADDPRPAAPGQQDATTGVVDAKTVGGLAGAILSAQRVSTQGQTAPQTPLTTEAHGDTEAGVPRFSTDDGEGDQAEEHGSAERAELRQGGGALAGAAGRS